MTQRSNIEFLKSACTIDGAYMPTADLIAWLTEQNSLVHVNVRKIRFDALKRWSFDEQRSRLRHDTGRFFSIEGIHVETNWGFVPQWDQPIINQPEIGYLGFIVRPINGIWHFLVQGKIEPGNINAIQISPTLQATKSNYTKVHEGKAPPYLEYFQRARDSQVLLDQLQSEQGARFLRKRNRNMIILTEEDIPLLPNYTWATLGQIKLLMQYDNLVNMDTRTVVSGITYGSSGISGVEEVPGLPMLTGLGHAGSKFYHSMMSNQAYHDFESLIRFVTNAKCRYELEVTKKPLSALQDWVIDDFAIHHRENKYFNVIAVDVEISSREVMTWTQPMIEPAQSGLCAFVCREIEGVLHFAVQAKLECGNFDIIELAPTVQCLTGNYMNNESVSNVPFLNYVLNSTPSSRWLDTNQSEEGGRFFKEQNRNMIVIAGEDVTLALPDNFVWMTMKQIQAFIQFNNYFNIQARSLVAALSVLDTHAG